MWLHFYIIHSQGGSWDLAKLNIGFAAQFSWVSLIDRGDFSWPCGCLAAFPRGFLITLLQPLLICYSQPSSILTATFSCIFTFNGLTVTVSTMPRMPELFFFFPPNLCIYVWPNAKTAAMPFRGGTYTSGFPSSVELAVLYSNPGSLAWANPISCHPDRLPAMHMPGQRQNLRLLIAHRGVGKKP